VHQTKNWLCAEPPFPLGDTVARPQAACGVYMSVFTDNPARIGRSLPHPGGANACAGAADAGGRDGRPRARAIRAARLHRYVLPQCRSPEPPVNAPGPPAESEPRVRRREDGEGFRQDGRTGVPW